jgi:hypothetical protein
MIYFIVVFYFSFRQKPEHLFEVFLEIRQPTEKEGN